MDWLRSYRPDLVPRYEELYARGAYAPRPSASGCRSSCARGGAGPASAPCRRPRAAEARRPPSSRRCFECQRQTAATRAQSSNAPLFIYELNNVAFAGSRPLLLPFSAAEDPAAPGRAATADSPPPGSRQAELLELAHVALEGQLFAADRARPGPPRASRGRLRSAPTSLASTVRAGWRSRSARAGHAGAPARRRRGPPARAAARRGSSPAQCSSMRQIWRRRGRPAPRTARRGSRAPRAHRVRGRDRAAVHRLDRVDRKLPHHRALPPAGPGARAIPAPERERDLPRPDAVEGTPPEQHLVARADGLELVGLRVRLRPAARTSVGRTAWNSPVSTSRSISRSISSRSSAAISPVSTWRRISRSRKRLNFRISSTITR